MTNSDRKDAPLKPKRKIVFVLGIIAIGIIVPLFTLGPLAVVPNSASFTIHGLPVTVQSCWNICLPSWKLRYMPYDFWTVKDADMGVGLGKGEGFLANGMFIDAVCIGGNHIVFQTPTWNQTIYVGCKNT